jgi:hypothetical protein
VTEDGAVCLRANHANYVKEGTLKQLLLRVIGLALVGAAIYVARVKLPSAYPLVFKATGVAVVTRSDINKVAAAYCITGAVGGLGLALFLGLGKRAER